MRSKQTDVADPDAKAQRKEDSTKTTRHETRETANKTQVTKLFENPGVTDSEIEKVWRGDPLVPFSTMSRSWSSLTPPLSATTASAITKMGFSAMTPVQSACIPLLLGGHKVGKIRMTLGNVNRIWNYISKSSFCLYQCRISCRVKKCPPSLDSGLLKPLKLGRNFASEIFRANGPPPEPDGATNESCFSRNFWVTLSGSGTWKTSEVNL